MHKNDIIDETKLKSHQPPIVEAFSDMSCVGNAIQAANVTYSQIDYEFNGDIYHSWGDGTYSGTVTFKLPENRKPSEIKSLNFINSLPVKTSWGDTPYYGKKIEDAVPKNKRFTDYSSNSAACHPDYIQYKGEYFELMNVKDYWASAVLITKQGVWFNWFYHEDNYFIQIAYSQYAEAWGSASGGRMWLNLGTGLTLHLYDDE